MHQGTAVVEPPNANWIDQWTGPEGVNAALALIAIFVAWAADQRARTHAEKVVGVEDDHSALFGAGGRRLPRKCESPRIDRREGSPANR